MNIKQLSWAEYHSYIDKLADKIGDNSGYTYIAALDHDDMIVAVHLAHKLKISIITDINILSLLVGITNSGDNILVVSNVVETGSSFKEVMEETKTTFDTAALFVDKNSKYKPTYHVEIPEDRIYFPWQKCGL